MIDVHSIFFTDLVFSLTIGGLELIASHRFSSNKFIVTRRGHVCQLRNYLTLADSHRTQRAGVLILARHAAQTEIVNKTLLAIINQIDRIEYPLP